MRVYGARGTWLPYKRARGLNLNTESLSPKPQNLIPNSEDRNPTADAARRARTRSILELPLEDVPNFIAAPDPYASLHQVRTRKRIPLCMRTRCRPARRPRTLMRVAAVPRAQ